MVERFERSSFSAQDQRRLHAPRDPTQHNVDDTDTIEQLQIQHRVYRFAWICALYFEMTAARAMLDEVHEPLASQPPEDTNNYLLGSICQHNVVIACLPNGQYGTNGAANVVANLQRTFPSIMFGLMVGIGGGIPDNEDIRLGDIVVGTKIVQHDLSKTLGEGKVHRTGQPVLPSRALNTTVSNLRSKHELEPSRISVILEERMGKYSDYCRPKAPDRLFQREYQHVPGVFGSPCGGCDLSNILPRSPRPSDVPSIHYGGIASGNQVLRDATTRGMIGTELDVLCFEMEAAGFMHVLDCLCIRGICDYSDSHKSKAWQKYSAAVAAAYARELLENFPRSSRSPVYQLPIATIQNSARLNTDANILERESMVEILKYPQMDSRQDTIEAAEGHTCRWFLANSHYQAWLDPEQLKISHGFLWITGKPGAGKSVMMKFLSAEMREQGQQTHGVIISFFFSAQGSTLQKSVTGMYRSLLHQLFGAYWDLPDILDRPEFRSRTVDTHLALNNLKALFKAAVLKLDRRRLTCFIDALDECDEQQALEMVRFFEDLTNTSTKNDIPLRICFSSRPYPHMMIPTSILLTLEDQPDHAADMKSYISNNLRIEDPKLAEELKLRIMQKASGVFMWVVVVIPILNNDDRWGRPTIKRQLEELPDSLSNLYKDILTRDKTNPDDLLFSVLWVLYAKWPLTPEEYYHALWCGLKLRGRADAEIPDVSDTFVREKINRYIVTSSKGLVEVTKFRVPTVQFIHETVRDFLLKENGLGYILSHAGPKRNSICHDMLKQCCGVFLSLCSTLDINEGLRGSHPFRRYCSLNILHHANAAAEHIPQRSFLADLDLPILVQGLRLFQKPPRYTEAVSLTYILAREGLSKLIPTWLEICPNIHIYGEEYRHPLFAAVNESRHTTAALLGVAPGSPEYQLVKRMNASDIDDTPLSLACRLGDFGMVRLLLNSGDDPNHTNKQGSSLLWEALKGGHDSISALLIEGGADANRKFHLTNMYLGLASSKGYHATAKCLLERGAVVDSIAWSWQTPLLEASRNGHEDIVSLLVEAGADLTRTDQKGRTALATASRRASPDLVRLLIEHGSDVNAKDKQDSTPLALALRAGRWQAAKILIENGADFNLSDLDGYPLLLRSSRGGHGDVVELLIQHGEDASMLPEPPVQDTTRNPLEDYGPSPELPIGPETFDNIFMRFL